MQYSIGIDRVTPLGLYRYSLEYFKAFNDLWELDKILNAPKYYLVCHAIELSFKSILRSYKYSVEELKNFGHDLAKLMQEIENKKYLSFSEEQREIINLVSPYYLEKDFEYIRVGSKTYPQLTDLSDFATYILHANGLLTGSKRS